MNLAIVAFFHTKHPIQLFGNFHERRSHRYIYKLDRLLEMATDLQKWGRFSAIFSDPRMRRSGKVVMGDGMDRQANDSDR